ncbi:MAG: AraC family transcriptional regulator, partial [Pirellulales bacterium]|nr:AraC family transcriptional regulator [Pirellulales bacterium]
MSPNNRSESPSTYDGFFHYLPVDDSAIDWGIYLTGAGRGRIHAGQPYPTADHPALYQLPWQSGRSLPEFQVILITDGRGVFESQPTGRLPVEAGRIICLFPDVWHRYRPDPETGWTERWISLSGRLTQRLMDRGFMRPEAPILPVGSIDDMAEAFDELLGRIHRDHLQNSVLLSLQAMGVLGKVLETTTDRNMENAIGRSTTRRDIFDPLVAEALDTIWTRSHRPLSVAQIAKPLPVSRRTLERRFLVATGHSVSEEIAACRLARAKRLLRETNLQIKAVSRLAGFSSEERMRVA